MSGRGSRGRDRSPYSGGRRLDDRGYDKGYDKSGGRGRGSGGRRDDRSRSPARRDGQYTALLCFSFISYGLI